MAIHSLAEVASSATDSTDHPLNVAMAEYVFRPPSGGIDRLRSQREIGVGKT